LVDLLQRSTDLHLDLVQVLSLQAHISRVAGVDLLAADVDFLVHGFHLLATHVHLCRHQGQVLLEGLREPLLDACEVGLHLARLEQVVQPRIQARLEGPGLAALLGGLDRLVYEALQSLLHRSHVVVQVRRHSLQGTFPKAEVLALESVRLRVPQHPLQHGAVDAHAVQHHVRHLQVLSQLALLDVMLLAPVQAHLCVVDHLQLPHSEASLERRYEIKGQLQLVALLLGEHLNLRDRRHVRAVEEPQEPVGVLRHSEEGHGLHDHGAELALLPLDLGLLVGHGVLVLEHVGVHAVDPGRDRAVLGAAAAEEPVEAVAVQLALRLQAVAIEILDALDVEDEDELGDDVEEGPTHLHEQDIVDGADALG